MSSWNALKLVFSDFSKSPLVFFSSQFKQTPMAPLTLRLRSLSFSGSLPLWGRGLKAKLCQDRRLKCIASIRCPHVDSKKSTTNAKWSTSGVAGAGWGLGLSLDRITGTRQHTHDEDTRCNSIEIQIWAKVKSGQAIYVPGPRTCTNVDGWKNRKGLFEIYLFIYLKICKKSFALILLNHRCRHRIK